MFTLNFYIFRFAIIFHKWRVVQVDYCASALHILGVLDASRFGKIHKNYACQPQCHCMLRYVARNLGYGTHIKAVDKRKGH